MGQNQNSSQNGNLTTRLLTGLVVILGLVCLGLWGVALFRSGYFSGAPTNPGITLAANNKLSCQELINQAMRISGSSCEHVGPNQVCYGNFTIHADLFPNANQQFLKTGDVIDIAHVESLTTSPLNLETKEWGIAIFNLIANLPRSLPGEAVKMVVFGNTTLDNKATTDIQSFYFSSELGQIVCDKVPFDGIMVTMPDGTGLRLSINGSELTLMGNAALKAVKNGNMEVSMLSGLGSITSNGQTQNFSAGQKVDVPLGGTTGNDAVGPPSPPSTLSSGDLALACTLSGIDCNQTTIPTIDPTSIQATLSVLGSETPIAGTATGVISTAVVPQATQPPPQNTSEAPPPAKTKIPPGLAKKTPTP